MSFLLCIQRLTHLFISSEYRPALDAARKAREESLQEAKKDSVDRLMKDLEIDRKNNPHAAEQDRWDPEEEEDLDEDIDVNIIDRSAYSFCFMLAAFLTRRDR